MTAVSFPCDLMVDIPSCTGTDGSDLPSALSLILQFTWHPPRPRGPRLHGRDGRVDDRPHHPLRSRDQVRRRHRDVERGRRGARLCRRSPSRTAIRGSISPPATIAQGSTRSSSSAPVRRRRRKRRRAHLVAAGLPLGDDAQDRVPCWNPRQPRQSSTRWRRRLVKNMTLSPLASATPTPWSSSAWLSRNIDPCRTSCSSSTLGTTADPPGLQPGRGQRGRRHSPGGRALQERHEVLARRRQPRAGASQAESSGHLRQRRLRRPGTSTGTSSGSSASSGTSSSTATGKRHLDADLLLHGPALHHHRPGWPPRRPAPSATATRRSTRQRRGTAPTDSGGRRSDAVATAPG